MPDHLPAKCVIATEPLIELLGQCRALHREDDGLYDRLNEASNAVLRALGVDPHNEESAVAPIYVEVEARAAERLASLIRDEAGRIGYLEAEARLMRERGTIEVHQTPEFLSLIGEVD